MNPLLILFLALAILLAFVPFSRKIAQAKESLVLEILKKLSEKFAQAHVATEGYAPGTLARKLHAENTGVTMDYSWPTGENTLGLPRVLSGILTEQIEWNKQNFSSLRFELAHEKERGCLGYHIELYKNGEPRLCVEGILGKRACATSLCLCYFDQVIALVGGEA